MTETFHSDVRAELTLLQPNVPPMHHRIESPTVTLGRAAECTIPIKDRFLSRKHCEICFEATGWVLKDCGSVNGTYVNGQRVDRQLGLRAGDRITLGDSEIVFQAEAAPSINLDDSSPSATISIPIDKLDSDTTLSRFPERFQILNALALELIEDRPMTSLFDFILDRLMKLLSPSRAALALLSDDGKEFVTTKVRAREETDQKELKISSTLLAEVVDEKRVLCFVDTHEDDTLRLAKSIIDQRIRSALCAPLVVSDTVVGVLYVDYVLNQGRITEEDARLVGQIARFAAVKYETTRLREEAEAMERLEEELRTAYLIQSRLLPSKPPAVDGYTLAGLNKPCRTVSGDYYDFIVRKNGKLYFVVADVSGKGLPAALIMSSLETAFVIFTSDDPAPDELLRKLNATYVEKLSNSKFITMFVGVLDPSTGLIEFANAGHTPPAWITSAGVTSLNTTDLLLGLFPEANYRRQSLTLAPGDSLVMFTDGITEAENCAGVEMGHLTVAQILKPLHDSDAQTIADTLELSVIEHCKSLSLGDDVTVVVLSRN